MLNFIKRLFVKNTLDLDNDGKIESLREEIQGVFSQFVKMNDKLDNVNQELDTVVQDELNKQKVELERQARLVEESNKRIQESNERTKVAMMEIEANRKLQDKVSEFLPNSASEEN